MNKWKASELLGPILMVLYIEGVFTEILKDTGITLTGFIFQIQFLCMIYEHIKQKHNQKVVSAWINDNIIFYVF